MGIAFAGSSHTKYAGYSLEMIVNLELESSPALKETFLKNWLVNPSGEPGRWIEGDLHLEHINLILETMIEHKDAEWDSQHIRTVVAPNVSHFVTLKNTYREGLGLAKRRGAHTSPHCRPEVRALLDAFKKEDVHRFRPGRHYGPQSDAPPLQNLNLFARGLASLREGKLEKWKTESRMRRMQNVHQNTSSVIGNSSPGRGNDGGDGGSANEDGAGGGSTGGGDSSDDEEPEGEDERVDAGNLQTDGMVIYEEGELIVDYGDWSLSDALTAGDDELDAPQDT